MPNFSDELKKEFQTYLKTGWITSGSRDRFEKDRDDAVQWIKDQDIYSTEDLYQQIKELKQQLKSASNVMSSVSGIIERACAA